MPKPQILFLTGAGLLILASFGEWIVFIFNWTGAGLVAVAIVAGVVRHLSAKGNSHSSEAGKAIPEWTGPTIEGTLIRPDYAHARAGRRSDAKRKRAA